MVIQREADRVSTERACLLPPCKYYVPLYAPATCGMARCGIALETAIYSNCSILDLYLGQFCSTQYTPCSAYSALPRRTHAEHIASTTVPLLPLIQSIHESSRRYKSYHVRPLVTMIYTVLTVHYSPAPSLLHCLPSAPTPLHPSSPPSSLVSNPTVLIHRPSHPCGLVPYNTIIP